MSFYPFGRFYPFSAPMAGVLATVGTTATADPPLFRLRVPVGALKFAVHGETHEGWTGPVGQPDSTFGFSMWPQLIQTWMTPSLLSSAASGVPNGTDSVDTMMGMSLGVMTAASGNDNNEAYIQLRARFGTTPRWELAYNRGGKGANTTEVKFDLSSTSNLIAVPTHLRRYRLGILWEPKVGANARIRAYIDGIQATAIVAASGSAPNYAPTDGQIRGLTFFVVNANNVDAQTEISLFNASIQSFPEGLPNPGTIL